MAQTFEYTDESATSATFNMTAEISEILVIGSFTGHVVLEMTIPDEDDWLPVFIATSRNASPISVPDLAVDYRVRASVAGTATIYVGP